MPKILHHLTGLVLTLPLADSTRRFEARAGSERRSAQKNKPHRPLDLLSRFLTVAPGSSLLLFAILFMILTPGPLLAAASPPADINDALSANINIASLAGISGDSYGDVSGTLLAGLHSASQSAVGRASLAGTKNTSQEARSEASGLTVSAARPFRSGITIDMARLAADSALRTRAAEESQMLLARQTEIRALLGHEISAGEDLPELPVFAYLLLQPESAPVEEVSGLPPALSLKLTCSFKVVPPEAQRTILLRLLENKSMLTNLDLAVEMEKTGLAAYDAAVADFLLAADRTAPFPASKQDETRQKGIRHGEIKPGEVRQTGGARSAEPADESGTAKICGRTSDEILAEVARSSNELRGIREYIRLLSDLYDESRLSADLLAGLTEANSLLPENYLLLSELGRLYLWLEQTGAALETLNRAITRNPDFSQPYSHRGTLLLLLHKPALALADFNRAIELAQDNAEFFYNRAVAWKALGDGASMCADLRQSCLLGQCAPYEWAYATGECRAD